MSDSGSGSGGDAAATVRAPVVPRLGAVLGRYELHEVLGNGAMATVFSARDTRLGREVAVKVMNLVMAARAESAERFRREAQAVAAVKHPGIVEIFDFVAATLEEPAYIVSELIRGPTLRRFLDQHGGRLLPEAAALVAIPLAEALAVAHARGIVHRDIKPDNVMLECEGQRPRVLLTDFGVAHVTGMETMTATGALVGSPAYMSPEQARGNDVGPASDQWALGVLLYEMATGHVPFGGKDPLMVVGAITRGLFKRPSQISGYAGAGFDEICGRVLKLVPEDRFVDLAALVEALRGFCRAGGIDDDGRALPGLLRDPEAFQRELRPKVADAAVATARKHMRRGEYARALAELSRATAYVPRHAEAERLMTTISSRRRWARLAAIAAALGVAAAGVVMAPRWMSRRRNPTPLVAAAPAAAATTTPARDRSAESATTGHNQPPPLASAGAGAPPQPTGAAAATSRGAGGAGPSKRHRERSATAFDQAGSRPASDRARPGDLTQDKEPSDSDSIAAPIGNAIPPAVTSTSREQTTADASPTGSLATAAIRPTRESGVTSGVGKRTRVEIYATNAFCDPSLDDGAAVLSPARYDGVSQTVHRVYCTTGHTKVLVAALPIAADPHGEPFRIQIRKLDGAPVIDATRTTRSRQMDPAEIEKPAPGLGASP